MDIQAEKIALAQLLLQTEDFTIIEKVKAIFKMEKKDWWDELSEEQKAEIEEGLRDADEGRVVPYDGFMQKYL